MENIYYRSILKRKVIVDAKYLNDSLDDYIQTYLKNKVEGRCIYEGYIRPDSVRLLKRSAGFLLGSRFTGDMTYEVAYSADICNPVEGNIVECKVNKVNKTGLFGVNGPLSILVSRELHEDNMEYFNTIKIGDMIKVYIIGKLFSLQDKEIKVIGKLHGIENKKNKKLKKENMVEQKVNQTNVNQMKGEEGEEEDDIDDMECEDSEEEEEEENSENESGTESESEEEEEEEEEGEVKIGGTNLMKNTEFGDDFSDFDGVEDDMGDDDMVDDGGDDDDDGYYSD